MRKAIFVMVLIAAFTIPVGALEIVAPDPPEDAQELIQTQTSDFGADLWKLVSGAIRKITPEFQSAAGVCAGVLGVVMLCALLQTVPGCPDGMIRLGAVSAVAGLMLQQTGSMISLGAETVQSLSEYGKLLVPVMAGALAAQGGATSSTALYGATAVFDAVLGSVTSAVLIPMAYLLLVMAVAAAASGEEVIKRIRELIQWGAIWFLKMVLYLFTGYIGITGIISGTADAAALKAAKITISGMVPVVGGILSDASEALLVGVGVMKSGAGIYGMLAIVAICVTPFFQIGIRYLMLKLTAAACTVFDVKGAAEVVRDFSSVMGLLLGVTGTMCMILLISVVAFMKGVG